MKLIVRLLVFLHGLVCVGAVSMRTMSEAGEILMRPSVDDGGPGSEAWRNPRAVCDDGDSEEMPLCARSGDARESSIGANLARFPLPPSSHGPGLVEGPGLVDPNSIPAVTQLLIQMTIRVIDTCEFTQAFEQGNLGGIGGQFHNKMHPAYRAEFDKLSPETVVAAKNIFNDEQLQFAAEFEQAMRQRFPQFPFEDVLFVVMVGILKTELDAAYERKGCRNLSSESRLAFLFAPVSSTWGMWSGMFNLFGLSGLCFGSPHNEAPADRVAETFFCCIARCEIQNIQEKSRTFEEIYEQINQNLDFVNSH